MRLKEKNYIKIFTITPIPFSMHNNNPNQQSNQIIRPNHYNQSHRASIKVNSIYVFSTIKASYPPEQVTFMDRILRNFTTKNCNRVCKIYLRTNHKRCKKYRTKINWDGYTTR